MVIYILHVIIKVIALVVLIAILGAIVYLNVNMSFAVTYLR